LLRGETCEDPSTTATSSDFLTHSAFIERSEHTAQSGSCCQLLSSRDGLFSGKVDMPGVPPPPPATATSVAKALGGVRRYGLWPTHYERRMCEKRGRGGRRTWGLHVPPQRLCRRHQNRSKKGGGTNVVILGQGHARRHQCRNSRSRTCSRESLKIPDLGPRSVNASTNDDKLGQGWSDHAGLRLANFVGGSSSSVERRKNGR
jgi:hypothetical protein